MHERPKHEPPELEDETRKQYARRLGVLIAVIIVVAVSAYMTGLIRVTTLAGGMVNA
jgi:hypothetical protein